MELADSKVGFYFCKMCSVAGLRVSYSKEYEKKNEIFFLLKLQDTPISEYNVLPQLTGRYVILFLN